MAEPLYLGVDIGGMDNTWVAGLSASAGSLEAVLPPLRMPLADIAEYCEDNDVVAVAIDAQLTAALSEENGFRTSDDELRKMLRDRGGVREWVASANGLMAVPVRGRLLAERLSPTVGTIIETHPRASLLFGLGEEALSPLRDYRDTGEVGRTHVETLWRRWSERFAITCEEPVEDDGALDSIVCATVAYLFHREPEKLHKLKQKAECKTGQGPFYVVRSEV